MGCNESKTKESAAPSALSSDALEFVNLANAQKQPVAILLLKEWTLFVNAQVKKNSGDSTEAEAYQRRPREIWADTENQPLTHRSVDYVGKMFLEYMKSDLSRRGWGGNFDYKVAGVALQGFLKATAVVDTAHNEVAEEIPWDIKIHYHSSGSA